jgi:pimeloyl-ACP methyl ester carboxylesterase
VPDAVLDALPQLVPGGVARGGVRRGGRTVRWAEAASGQPAVVLEAGRNDTAITWAPGMAVLAGRAQVVAYDRAGPGASDPAPGRGHTGTGRSPTLPRSSPPPRAGGACWPGTAGAETVGSYSRGMQ